MQNLPPVFSPENSPPSGFASRRDYLPLISPAPTEEGRQFDFSGSRRGSTPSLTKSSASQYFEELRKRRRTSESAFTPTQEQQQLPSFANQEHSEKTSRFAELPSSIAQSILRALESQAKATSGAIGSISLKKRTMSMPASASEVFSGSYSEHRDPLERRASMRSQQLALLASQARLVRTGATSVHTAIRAERAVTGAVKKAVEDAQISKGVNVEVDNVEESTLAQEDPSRENVTKADGVVVKSVVEGQGQGRGTNSTDSSQAWSEALASPQSTTAFLNRASEVAHDWANGFYRFEEKWAEDALQKEKRRLSEHHTSSKRPRIEDLLDQSGAGAGAAAAEKVDQNGPSSPRKGASSPPSRETSPNAKPNTISEALIPASLRSSLVAAHKRLSASLPTMSATSSVHEGGQLVDVLSNFVSLIEQRKETCHGLEKLAQDARRLSTVPLPSISTALAQHAEVKEEEEEEGEEEDDEEKSNRRG